MSIKVLYVILKQSYQLAPIASAHVGCKTADFLAHHTVGYIIYIYTKRGREEKINTRGNRMRHENDTIMIMHSLDVKLDLHIFMKNVIFWTKTGNKTLEKF